MVYTFVFSSVFRRRLPLGDNQLPLGVICRFSWEGKWRKSPVSVLVDIFKPRVWHEGFGDADALFCLVILEDRGHDAWQGEG